MTWIELIWLRAGKNGAPSCENINIFFLFHEMRRISWLREEHWPSEERFRSKSQ